MKMKIKIIYTDGGVLFCTSIKVCGDILIANDVYEIRLDEIEEICV